MKLKPEEIIGRGRDAAMETRQAADAILDKRRNWMMFAVGCAVSFVLGAWIF